MKDPKSLTDILDAVGHAGTGEKVSVGEIFDEVGNRSFAPALLVPAILLVSPISGIPGVPTIGSIVMLIITVQALIGKDKLWVPDFLRRRKIPSRRLDKALDWLRKPSAWVDRKTERRMAFLTRHPWDQIALVIITIVAMILPFLEILPMVTSVACFAISLFALGIMVSDGLLVLSGYAFVGGFVALIYTLMNGGI